MRVQITATSLCILLYFTAPSLASTAGIVPNVPAEKAKQPWEWTPAERAEARRNPAKRLERLRTSEGSEGERRTSRISANSVPTAADVIDSTRNPELFFVTELFEILVRSAFVTLPAAYPEIIRQRTYDLFRNRADWDQFAVIVADYAEVLKQEKAAADALNKSEVSEIQLRKCAAAGRALREARRTFGTQRFDRMLYETVPLGMRAVFSIDTDFDKSIGKALEREEHCQ